MDSSGHLKAQINSKERHWFIIPRGSNGLGMAAVDCLPSGYVKIAIEHGPVEIVDFSH